MRLHNLSGGERSSADAALNAALVGSALDQEVAAIAPLLVPAVLNFPVLGALKLAVANQSDGVATQSGSRLVSVHSGLVGGEIGVDGESHVHGSVGHELLHDLRLAADGVGACCLLLPC